MTAPASSFGRYEILNPLGGGGFATVFRAWDPLLSRQVALKILLPHLTANPEVRRRFLAEARALAALQHPNIIAFYDVGEAQGQPFIAMELIDGPTLAAWGIERGAIGLDDLFAVLPGLCSAIDYLHDAGLVHRDIKASNVMLDQGQRSVLMDFGVVRVLDETQFTRTGASIGTPAAMAPEQVLGTAVGPPADIYALAVLAYQLLAGRPPFVGDTAFVLHAQAYVEPPSLRDFRPDLPPAIHAAIARALAKLPEQRPLTAAAFLGMLRGSLPVPPPEPVTILGPLPPPAVPVEQRRSRRPILAAAAAIAILALAGAAGVYALTRPSPALPTPTAAAATKPVTATAAGASTAAAATATQVSATVASPTGSTTAAVPTVGGGGSSTPPPPARTPASASVKPTAAPTVTVTLPPPPLFAPGTAAKLDASDAHDDSRFCSALSGQSPVTEVLTLNTLTALTADTIVVEFTLAVPPVTGSDLCVITFPADAGHRDSPLLVVQLSDGSEQKLPSTSNANGLAHTGSANIYGTTQTGAWEFTGVDASADALFLEMWLQDVNGQPVLWHRIPIIHRRSLPTT